MPGIYIRRVFLKRLLLGYSFPIWWGSLWAFLGNAGCASAPSPDRLDSQSKNREASQVQSSQPEPLKVQPSDAQMSVPKSLQSPTEPSAKDSELKLLDPASSIAVKVNYVESGTLVVDPNLRRVRQGVDFENQTCLNCLFYVASGNVSEPPVGQCRVVENQLVKGEGWCQSWAKRLR